MVQKDLNNEEWEEITPFDDEGEILKLQEGQAIEGILQDVFESKKYSGHNIIKIKPKDDTLKVILGTTVLDTKIKQASIGDIVKIHRVKDQKNDKGQTYQDYRVYKKKKTEAD